MNPAGQQESDGERASTLARHFLTFTFLRGNNFELLFDVQTT